MPAKSTASTTAIAATLAVANPCLGQTYEETFADGLGGWDSGRSVVTHEASGGVGLSDDGWMRVTTLNQKSVRTLVRSSWQSQPASCGNYAERGVTAVEFSLNGLETDEGQKIHVGFGNGDWFWVSNEAFEPQPGVWTTHRVDFVASNFTRVRGEETFEFGLSTVARLQFRHQNDGPASNAGVRVGSFGVDGVRLIGDGPQPCSWADLVAPYGVFEISDVVTFLQGYGAFDLRMDFSAPFGIWDIADIVGFLQAFGGGCP